MKKDERFAQAAMELRMMNIELSVSNWLVLGE
jgi:hypothetical protein